MHLAGENVVMRYWTSLYCLQRHHCQPLRFGISDTLLYCSHVVCIMKYATYDSNSNKQHVICKM